MHDMQRNVLIITSKALFWQVFGDVRTKNVLKTYASLSIYFILSWEKKS